MIDEGAGFVVFRVGGKGAEEAFGHEAGGHRWQRVPPNEKRDRVQTSTVTVAVLPEPREVDLTIDPRDLDWRFCRGSGAGGQHRNKTETAVQLTHLPTGTSVRCEAERSQQQNKQAALALLRARLWEERQGDLTDARSRERRAQVGSGMRGDKRRTVQVKNDAVTDHVLNRSWKFAAYERGDW